MGDLKQKIALLEERYKSWRIQQQLNEKQMQQNYERSLVKLDEYYKAAERQIDLEFSAKKELLLEKYRVKVDYKASVGQVNRVPDSDETKTQNSTDKDPHMMVSASLHRSASPTESSLPTLTRITHTDAKRIDLRAGLLRTESIIEQKTTVKPTPKSETTVMMLRSYSVGSTIEPKLSDDRSNTSVFIMVETFAPNQKDIDVVVMNECNRIGLFPSPELRKQFSKRCDRRSTETTVFDPGGPHRAYALFNYCCLGRRKPTRRGFQIKLNC